jgi:hypothetical protein
VLGLVAVPLIQPMFEEQEEIVKSVKPEDLDDSDVQIKSFEDRINTQKIQVGVVVIFIYAMLFVYLTSNSVKKYIFQCRPDRFL